MKNAFLLLSVVFWPLLAVGQSPKADLSSVPGVVISHSPASTRYYVGSPSIAMLPDGSYAASHDLFAKGRPGRGTGVVRVFRSTDRGKTWSRTAEIDGIFWATLFAHRSALYLMGTDAKYGRAVIRKSADQGKTWTVPKDADSGLLVKEKGCHCAPVPVLIHKGRIWRGMEDNKSGGGWGAHFRAFMMSAPVDADLLKASSWTISNRLPMDKQWLGGKFGGWLEGNAVAAPDGKIVDILRADYRFPQEKAAIIHISDDGKTASFDPEKDFIDFPGGCKKFTIRYDPKSKYYWTLSNFTPKQHHNYNIERTRNTLALSRSADLRKWEVRCVVLYHKDPEKHGFQYADWLFDGNDLIAAIRTAHDDGLGGAHNQHDANMLTFHRIVNFRDLTMQDSVEHFPLSDSHAYGP